MADAETLIRDMPCECGPLYTCTRCEVLTDLSEHRHTVTACGMFLRLDRADQRVQYEMHGFGTEERAQAERGIAALDTVISQIGTFETLEDSDA